MRFIVFTLVSMLVLSSNLYSQNLGIKVFCSETNWSVRRFINNINSFDTNRTEEIRNQQSKVMDYGLGLTAQFKKNKNNLKSKKSNKNLLLVVFIKIQQV